MGAVAAAFALGLKHGCLGAVVGVVYVFPFRGLLECGHAQACG